MEPPSGYACYSVEVSNLVHRASTEEVNRMLRPRLAGLVSISYVARSGRATVELSSRPHAEAAVRQINGLRELAYSPPGQARTLRAQILATSATQSFMQTEEVQQWRSLDDSALPEAEQLAKNDVDLAALFDRLSHGGMRDSIQAEVRRKQAEESLVLKELYLSLGRQCELVFAGNRGQKDTHVLRSAEGVQQPHLDEFLVLFGELPEAARRTGIDATLHRIARSIHAIARRPTAVTARVGRTIQGTVLPMLVDSSAPDPIEALAQMASKGLLLIGAPNVGKTTVLRELARLLSRGDRRVVVIVDKSMEIAGTGVVPHEAIGHARVLTVARPEDQHRTMIEAVENQSPDVVIVDEISNKEECCAARTIAGRGCAVVATVHGDGLASVLQDPERSVLYGGVASVTLSAREAEARPDKLRQVQKRMGASVFGTAVELRGYHDWVVHEDLDAAVDKYLDYAPLGASWRTREGETIRATPLVGCRQQGSSVGFAYAKLRKGEALAAADGVNFQATDPVSGQRLWTELGVGSRIYERTPRGEGEAGFHFATPEAKGGTGGSGGAFQFGGSLGAF